MCKKVLIAAVAVVVALVVLNFTRAGSHLRLWKKQVSERISQKIPPEQEIKRLQMELDNLAKEDERHFHKVATQIVEVEKMKKQVASMKQEIKDREDRIFTMKASLKGDDKFVTYKGEKYSRETLNNELRSTALYFQVAEERFKSLEEQLSIREKNLAMNRKKLAELQLHRQQMRTELEKLDTALAQERLTQASQDNTLDDASYQKLKKEIGSVQDRIEVLKQKRILKGENDSPVKAAEQKKEQEAAIDRYLESRFGEGNKQ